MEYKRGDLVRFPKGRIVWFCKNFSEYMPPGSVAVVLETSGDHMKLVFFSNGEQANGFYKGASDIELVTEHVDG